jgi:hypothetical protein
MLKAGVRVLGIRPEVVLALMIARDVYESFGAHDSFVITSAVEGQHKRASKHYSGAAVDLRRPNAADIIVADLQRRLGNDYDVILEADHVHLEYDPKLGL